MFHVVTPKALCNSHPPGHKCSKKGPDKGSRLHRLTGTNLTPVPKKKGCCTALRGPWKTRNLCPSKHNVAVNHVENTFGPMLLLVNQRMEASGSTSRGHALSTYFQPHNYCFHLISWIEPTFGNYQIAEPTENTRIRRTWTPGV